jgi:putative ABC transport system permease protein
MLWATLIMSLREIRRNTLRSGLTTLGIVIGVASVISMVTLGQGATDKVTADIGKMGNNVLTVIPGAHRHGPMSATAPLFSQADVQAIERELPDLLAVAPLVNRAALLVYGNKNHNTTVNGSTNAFFVARNFHVVLGRTFSDAELRGGSPACILGTTVHRELFGSQYPLGTSIRVGQVSCRVVGVLESKGQSTFGSDQDDLIVMPLRTVQRRLVGNNDIGAIMVSTKTDRVTAKIKRQLELLMQERRRIAPKEQPNYTILDMKEFQQTMQTVTGVLTALLGSIAAVSLLVGGIGIMNIMLVSVTERTREIGVRMAIGATSAEVLLQFLTEAVVLSTLGGVMGMLLGLGASALAARGLGLPFVIVPWVVVVAVVFSASVGIAFGFFPARKASLLDPIEALRHE